MHLSKMFSRTTTIAIGGVLGAVALLAIGGFVGNAMASDSDEQPLLIVEDTAADGRPEIVQSDIAVGSGSVSPQRQPPRPAIPPRGISTSGGDGNFGADEAIARPGGYYGFCQGTLEGALSGTVLDLGANGFAPNLLPAGYVLSGLNLRTEHDCVDEDAQWTVLDTTWLTEEGLFRIWVSQRDGGGEVANILRDYWAEFSYEGSSYSVSISQVFPFDRGPIPVEGDGGIATDIAYPNEDPAAMRAALAAVVNALAPNLGEQCFYRQTEGGWDSLAGLGIGDPRGAVPSDFHEDGFWAEVFEPPAAGCDVPTDVHIPVSINASWSNGDNAWLGFSIWGDNPEFRFEEPGSQSEHHVSWTDGTYRYEVWGSRGEHGLGSEVLEGLARALDPDFDGTCRLVEIELTDEALAALGIGIPTAPDGFELRNRHARGSEANGNCDADFDDGFASGNWTFSDSDGSVIDASAWLAPNFYDEPFPEGGFIGEGHINWQSPNGVGYSVSGWSEFGGQPDQELLIEVALSMDPTLDVDSLEDGPIALPLAEPEIVTSESAGADAP